MSYIALYQGTASEAAEKVRNADSSWAEAHSEWQEERTCTAHLKVRPFKTHGKCLFSAASEAVPLQSITSARDPRTCGSWCGAGITGSEDEVVVSSQAAPSVRALRAL